MAVLVIARVPDMGSADRERWRERNKTLPQQPGFLFQGDGPAEGGWLVVSAWESSEDFERYYQTSVKPNIPPGMPEVKPEVQDLEAVVTK